MEPPDVPQVELETEVAAAEDRLGMEPVYPTSWEPHHLPAEDVQQYEVPLQPPDDPEPAILIPPPPEDLIDLHPEPVAPAPAPSWDSLFPPEPLEP